MKPSAVASEAWRNLMSGTSRPVLLVVLLGAVLGSLAVADARTIVGLSVRATQFRESGAAVHLVTSPGAVDGRRCDALGSLPGVSGAGATRQAPTQAAFLTAPRSGIATVEATDGLAGVLGVADATGVGVWLSDSAAGTLGADVGTTVPTSLGPALVAARYVYPSAATDRTLAHALVETVPASGRFDTCWVLVWPQQPVIDTLLRGTVAGDAAEPPEATFGQLDTSLGADLDGPELLRSRATSGALPAAALLGLVVGVAAVWSRRLELAGALHAQVPRQALVAQVALELLAVVLVAALIALPLTAAAAVRGNPDPIWPAWSAGVRVVGAGLLTVLVGGLLAAAATNEARLFRYLKDR